LGPPPRLTPDLQHYAMAGFHYRMTFIDEPMERQLGIKRVNSSPAVMKEATLPKDLNKLVALHQDKHLELQVSSLQRRSQQLSVGGARSGCEDAPLPQLEEIPSLGSYGHPSICRRPCILFIRGTCKKGADCGFCHLRHESRLPSFDKKQRDFLKLLPSVTFLEMILPFVRKRVEDNELPGAVALLQLLESEFSIRSYPIRAATPHTPRKISYVLERMSLSNLVSVIASTLPGRFPKLMSNELGYLRETARALDPFN